MSIASPDLLRLLLLGGLVLHKMVWEFLKRQSQPTATRRGSRGLLRRLFKAAKSLVLVFLLVQVIFLNIFPITGQPMILRSTGLAVFLVGLAVALLGRVQLGKNWMDLEDLEVSRQESLATRGLYAYIRHPIYSGDILLLVGLELALNSWLVFAMLLPIVIFTKQAQNEEAELARKFREYDVYSRRTKRFIPFLV